MLDPAFVRENPETVRAAFANRGLDATAELAELAALEGERRRAIPELEALKRAQNDGSAEVARAKKQGLDASHLFEASKARGAQIKALEAELRRWRRAARRC